MGVKGKLVSQISIKSEADLFQMLRFPSQCADVTPEMIQQVDLLAGHWGTVGSIICWDFTQDGKKKVSKEIIEAIDEKKKSITFKAIEGDLLDAYDTFKIIVDISTNGADNLVTWSLEYEKKCDGVPEPYQFMDFLLQFSKEIECNRPALQCN